MAKTLREVIRSTQYKNNEFIMCYAGNLGFAQGISEILNAFIIFNEKFVENNFRLNLIGEGPEKQVTESLVKSHNLEKKITFFGSLPKNETITHLNNSDVLLIPLIKSEAFKYTIPSKVFDYLQVGKPIISTIQGEGREILESSEANILTDLDEGSLSISFQTMYEKYDYFNTHCNRNIELSKRFSREKSNQNLLRYMKSIIHTEPKH